MERLTEKQVIEKLRMIEFPPLEISCREVDPYLPFAEYRSKYRPDMLVDVEWQGNKFQFVAEIKSLSTPKLIDQAIWQLTGYLDFFKNRQTAETYYPLIVAPYISERSFTELTASGVSGIDLSGNVNLLVPGKMLFSRTGQPNKYRSSGPIKNIYRGTSSIVARVILSKRQFESVNKVLDEVAARGGKTSLGTVSKVLKTLEDDLIISRSSGVKLIDPKTLLDKLRRNYRAPRAVRKTIGKVDDRASALVKIAENCGNYDLLCAIDEPQKYGVFPTVGAPTRIYVENTEKALEEIEFEETNRFANIELIEISESPTYFDRRRELSAGAYYTSPLQTYLDLTAGGKREQEVAEQLTEQIFREEGAKK